MPYARLTHPAIGISAGSHTPSSASIRPRASAYPPAESGQASSRPPPDSGCTPRSCRMTAGPRETLKSRSAFGPEHPPVPGYRSPFRARHRQPFRRAGHRPYRLRALLGVLSVDRVMRPIAAILARLLARRARAALLSLPPAVALALAQQLLDRGDASFRWMFRATIAYRSSPHRPRPACRRPGCRELSALKSVQFALPHDWNTPTRAQPAARS